MFSSDILVRIWSHMKSQGQVVRESSEDTEIWLTAYWSKLM